MIPGILIGIEAQSVDFDAVAYRTAVILCEDPGSPAYPDEAWEVIESYRKEDIDRFGLAVSKDSPGILSLAKIERFFNGTLFTQDDIQDRMLFSNQPFGPYAYNVMLKLDDGTGTTVYELDSNAPIPDDPYGYMRRVVKVKGENYMDLELSNASRKNELTTTTSVNVTKGYLPVNFNLTELQDDAIPKIYQINPSLENVTIRISNFSSTINPSDQLDNVSLVGVTIYKGYGESLTEVAGSFSDLQDDRYIFTIGGGQYPLTNTTGAVLKSTNITDFDDIELVLRPALFSYLDPLAGDTVQVNFTFQYYFNSTMTNNSVLNGGYPPNSWSYGPWYDYNTSNVTRMPFRTGELEVAIW